MTETTGRLLGWGALTTLGAAALYQGLVTRSYALPTNKWAHGRRLRFAVVSDLHNVRFGHRQKKLLRMVERARPDYLLLPGDILTDNGSTGPTWEFLRGAVAIAPTFYAPGNHEYRIPRMARGMEKATRCGVHVLLDQSVRLDTAAGPLRLAGCEDSEKRKRDPRYQPAAAYRATFADAAGDNALTVLLAHQPEPWANYANLGFDLVVSGHAHGGQMRLPWVNGLFAPDQGFLPAYAGGLYQRGGSAHLISRGVVVYRYLPRVFNPPEVVTLDVVGVGTGGAVESRG